MRKKFGDSDGVITPYEEKRGKAIAKATGNPYKKGGSVKKKSSSAYHTTKDGRRVKKGLYYYMNKAKKSGKSRPGKGTVTDKALKRSAKTAKKA
jgi:hypothetical protein